jgi:hypothetical protein
MSSLSTVLLPPPVAPTIATVVPAGTSNVTPPSAGRPSYEKCRSSNRIDLGACGLPGTGAVATRGSGVSSRSMIRRTDAIARLYRSVMSASRVMGHSSRCVRYTSAE